MRAVIYARFSSDNQRDESIDAQVRACTDYANSKGFQLIKVYEDKALTATSDRRPAFLRMIADAEAGLFDAVIIHKLDRFSRDRYDHAYYKRKLKRAGVQLFSVLENLDSSPESIILESVLEGMSEYYSKNLAREVKKGLHETALQCKHTGGIPPLGYDLGADKKYIVNEQEAGAVQLIFKLYASGMGYNTIIDKLNELGYVTKRGGQFGKNSIHDILKNEKYIGIYTFGKTVGGKSGPRNSHSPSPDMLRIAGGVPAIIDIDTWEKVQRKMGRHKSGAFKAKHVYLLTGKIICGNCGGAMVGEPCKNRAGEPMYYYVCATRKRKKTCLKHAIPCAKVESAVLQKLEECLFSSQKIKALSQDLFNYQKEMKTEVHDSITAIQRQIEETETKLYHITLALEQGIVTATTKQRLLQLEARQEQLQEELNEARNSAEREIIPLNVIIKRLQRFKNLSSKSITIQKEAIELFVQNVICTDENSEVKLYLGNLVDIEKPELLSSTQSKNNGSDSNGGPPHNRINPNILFITLKL